MGISYCYDALNISGTPGQDDYFNKVHQIIENWQNGQPQFTIHSSGSTGAPKNISLKRHQMIHSAHTTGKALNLPENSKALIALNVEMIAGLMMMVRTLELGWESTVIHPVADPLSDLPDHLTFDFAALTPIQLNTMLQKHSKETISLKFRKILLGGAPIDSYLLNQISELQTEVYQSYGMTETVSHVALRKVNGANLSSDYQLLDDIEAGIDERGCLFLIGTITDFQKIQTNDLVEFTGQRTFKWIGRADNIINSGGIKIQLDKIDNTLSLILNEMNVNSPFFSWAVKDQLLGQKLVVVMQAENSENLYEQLKQRMLGRLTKYEIPKEIIFLDEFLKTPSGKIDKAATVNKYVDPI